MNTTAWAKAPLALQDRIFVRDNILHASAELRGNVALESYVSLLRKQGLEDVCFYVPVDFDALRLRQDTSHKEPANAVQGQAIELLREAYEAGASDIHIAYHATHGSIRLRRMGMLEEGGRQWAGDATITLIRAIYQSMTEASSPQFFPNQRQEGRIVRRDYLPPTVYSVRVHTEPLECAHGQGVLMTMRLLYDKIQIEGPLQGRLSALGYPTEECAKIERLTLRNGLILVAGPTGHGKSTLLRHVMEAQALETPQRSYLSIEDPPEYPIQRVSQVLVTNDNEQRGRAYQLAIAGAMRSDPDVLMIGEVRYPEAASAALDAALTGHTVWSSLHAGSALGIMARMFSLLTTANFADPMNTLCDPSILAGLIYQRLLPVLCPHCRQPLSEMLRHEKKRDKLVPVLQRLRGLGMPLEKIYFRGEGCARCKRTGVARLTVASEVIVTDGIFLDFCRKRDMASARVYWREQQGGKTALESALSHMMEGDLDPLDTENRLGMPLDYETAASPFAHSPGAQLGGGKLS